MAPGDVALRHDVQMLADAGILRTPVTTWPISWPDVARDVNSAAAAGSQPEYLQQSLRRVTTAARAAAVTGFSGFGYGVAAAERPIVLRDFAAVPREDGELSVWAQWLGDRIAGAVRVTAVVDAQDGQRYRLDGSYVGFTVGNFMISFGQMDRWWGPGWDGSLILSSNARPMPSLTVERNYSDASRLSVLRWFGPWRATLALGQAEGSDVAVPDVRFLAARLAFKPRTWLEVGLSRTAQWCGKGRTCNFSTLTDLLIGRDNRSESLTVDKEPGNQMAGYDVRLRLPWKIVPTTLYAQFIGEDEANGLPSKFLGLAGLEVASASGIGSWRVRAEYADTTCVFTREEPEFNCAYRNTLFPQGYSYRGRSIGHSIDGDGRMATLAAVLVRPSGTSFSGSIRRVDLNRDRGFDPAHTVSPLGADLDNIELQVSTRRFDGLLQLGIGYDDYSGNVTASSGMHGFVRFSRGL
ncbi:MAG: capsule assembly Wzi family protein [Steroidobacteraceae bacterium]